MAKLRVHSTPYAVMQNDLQFLKRKKCCTHGHKIKAGMIIQTAAFKY